MNHVADPDFTRFFREMYAYIGRPLTGEHEMSSDETAVAEERLGIKAPKALVSYYHVAGNEKQFNLSFDELLRPDQWYIEDDRLVFYVAHQAVVIYGIKTDALSQADPPVECGNPTPPLTWFPNSPSTTQFLQITSYWQGVFGGAMVNVEWAKVEPELRKKLDAYWEYIGELNEMFCYRKPNQVACFLKWGDEWHVYAGGADTGECDAISRELGITWEPWE